MTGLISATTLLISMVTIGGPVLSLLFPPPHVVWDDWNQELDHEAHKA
ncbi:hypothetical protein QNO07_08580 [Streptomyces sp. 549]|nr:hypothetical protein [Streptomyces sp. 549]MDK1473471.1 hypothetical protein [Streptomyces sp. 549]